jgi:hypothetical protein
MWTVNLGNGRIGTVESVEDVDLDQEEFYFGGERLTEARAEQLGEEMHWRRRILSGGPRVTFGVHVVRDGKWWMISIPDILGLTQARNPGEVELMAREYISLTLDVEMDSFDIELSGPVVE